MSQFPGHSPHSFSDYRARQRIIESFVFCLSLEWKSPIVEARKVFLCFVFSLSLEWKSRMVEARKVLSGPCPFVMGKL